MAHSINLAEYTAITFLNDDDKFQTSNLEVRQTLVDSAAVIISPLCCN
jgi:hypothetical protein